MEVHDLSHDDLLDDKAVLRLGAHVDGVLALVAGVKCGHMCHIGSYVSHRVTLTLTHGTSGHTCHMWSHWSHVVTLVTCGHTGHLVAGLGVVGVEHLLDGVGQRVGDGRRRRGLLLDPSREVQQNISSCC